jgi:translocator protein
VWSALYAMIAVSGWLVWRSAGYASARTALLLFAVQLIVNAAWSWVFFGLHRPGLALVVIVVLELSILGLIVIFRQHSTVASLLLVPYLAWVAFASALNAAIWRLNT